MMTPPRNPLPTMPLVERFEQLADELAQENSIRISHPVGVFSLATQNVDSFPRKVSLARVPLKPRRRRHNRKKVFSPHQQFLNQHRNRLRGCVNNLIIRSSRPVDLSPEVYEALQERKCEVLLRQALEKYKSKTLTKTEEIILLAVVLCFRPVAIDDTGKEFVCFIVAEGILHEGAHQIQIQRLFIEYLRVFYEKLYDQFLPSAETGERLINGFASVLESCYRPFPCEAESTDSPCSKEVRERRETGLECLKLLCSIAATTENSVMLNRSPPLIAIIRRLLEDPYIDPRSFQHLLQYMAINKVFLSYIDQGNFHCSMHIALDVPLCVGEILTGSLPSSLIYPNFFLRELGDLPIDLKQMIANVVDILDSYSPFTGTEMKCAMCLKRYVNVIFRLMENQQVELNQRGHLCRIAVTSLRSLRSLGLIDDVDIPDAVFDAAWYLSGIRNLQQVSSELMSEICLIRASRKRVRRSNASEDSDSSHSTC